MEDSGKAADHLIGAMTAAAPVTDQGGVKGTYTATCTDAEGQVLWQEQFDNLITNVGKILMLDQSLAGSSYTAAEYMGLISSTSFGPSTTTTISSLGSYTSGTGAISVTTAGAHGLIANDVFTVASVTGTGANISAVNGTWVATSGTTGTTLNFTVATGQTITTLTGGNVAAAIKAADTMASHGGWLEAGGTNAPSMSSTRQTCAWSGASGTGTVSKALSAGLAFVFTATSGTVAGAFLVGGASASATKDNTGGTLISAGALTTAQPVVNGNTLTVSYTAQLT